MYIDELGKLVDQVAPAPFAEMKAMIDEDLPPDALARIDEERSRRTGR